MTFLRNTQIRDLGIGDVMAEFSANDREVMSPASTSLISQVSVVDVQPRAPLSPSSLPVHSVKCTGIPYVMTK